MREKTFGSLENKIFPVSFLRGEGRGAPPEACVLRRKGARSRKSAQRLEKREGVLSHLPSCCSLASATHSVAAIRREEMLPSTAMLPSFRRVCRPARRISSTAVAPRAQEAADLLVEQLAQLSVSQRGPMTPSEAPCETRPPGEFGTQRGRTHGSFQARYLTYRLQHPFAAPSSEGTEKTDQAIALLAPQANAAYCPIESVLSEEGARLAQERAQYGTLYDRLLGSGTNARVFALARPARTAEIGFDNLDAALAIKIPNTNLLRAASEGTDEGERRPREIDAGAFLATRPCWNPTYRDYACPVDVEAEALLTALASGLFTDGITPGTVVMGRAFVCGGPASKRPLVIIQERLGVDHRIPPTTGQPLTTTENGVRTAASVEHLPAFLEQVEGRQRSLLVRAHRIESATVEICISILHTLAVLQESFGMNVLDVRPANLLLKALQPGALYFRGADTHRAARFLYSWPSPPTAPSQREQQGQCERGFALPNRGWLPKVGDLGMAVAYRVAYRPQTLQEPSEEPPIDTLSVGAERWSERFVTRITQRALEAQAALDISVGKHRAQGATLADARCMANGELTDAQVDALQQYRRLLQERSQFGITTSFMAGYDAHTLVVTLADACYEWTGTVPPPIAFLRDTLGYGLPAERASNGRPAAGSASPHGPLDALNRLYDVALQGAGPVALSLRPYLPEVARRQRRDGPWVDIHVPSGPVFLTRPATIVRD